MQTSVVPRAASRSSKGRRALPEAARKGSARAQEVRADDVLAEAMGVALATQVQRLQDSLRHFVKSVHDDSVRATRSVHEARVAIRKMHVTLDLLRPLVGSKKPEELRKELKTLGRALGRVRDLDVCMEVASAADIQVERERQKARAELRRLLVSGPTRRLFRRLNRVSERLLRRGLSAHERPAMLVRDVVASTIIGRYEKMAQHLRDVDAAGLEHLHLLRRYVRSLRYAIELFGEALGELRPHVLPRLVAAQQSLGNLHDAEVAAQRSGSEPRRLEQRREAALEDLSGLCARDFHDAIFHAAQLPFKRWACDSPVSPCATPL